MPRSILLHCTAGVLIILLINSVQSQDNYNPPSEHFINCGSKDAIHNVYRRTFIADDNRDGVETTSTSPTSPLYQTARVFKRQSWYKLKLDENGTYILRLHFFPLSNDLREAKFNVSASEYSLLSNFSIGNSNNLPVIKEFIFSIDAGDLKIIFTPQKSSSAFVNAIETFIAPKDFIQSSAFHVTVSGSSGDDYKDLLNRVLVPVFRINVGGDIINPGDDTLWRNWLPDDKFLYAKEAAKNSIMYMNRPKYPAGGATEYIAPDRVYQTAKEMNIKPGAPSDVNVTWQFNVTRDVKQYFIRAHFCDIIHDAQNFYKFKFYINSLYGSDIDLKEKDQVNYLETPFFYDFVVDSGFSGLLNISVGPWPGTKNQTAFLNGLEIMEVMNNKSLDGLGESKTKKKTLNVIIGSVAAGVVSVFFILLLFAIGRRKKAKAKAKPVENMDWPLANMNGGNSFSGPTESTATNVPEFNLELKVAFSEILYATNNFDPNLIIGKGGFGKVYKGTLRSGMKVAVKRSERGHGQGFPEFQTEIMVLSSIRHRHLVSLIGYCDEMSEMILVYEFMEKGTLREHLYKGPDFKSPTTPHLSYKQRLEICIGAAKGLHYLHTAGSGGGIIHRDVKSTNILLDKDFVAKVSDFGLSRSGLPDETHISTDVKGTFGYLDPEYFRCMQLTQKSDVYSFGVVLLEVICARPAINKMLPREQVNLGEWGVFWQQKGQLEMIIDPLLVGKINLNSLRKFGETAFKCLKECGADRPSMVDVIWDLEYALQLQQFQLVTGSHEDRSNTEFSWATPLPLVQRLPSTSMTIDDEEMYLGVDDILDSSYGDASDVFSQLKVDGAR